MIPITIVTGFLGSGKTSLVAHLLDNTIGRSIGVIVNEIDTASVDVAYLTGGEHVEVESGALMRIVAGGPLHGANLDRFAAAVIDLAKNHSVEAIVVETSGASSIGDLIGTLTSPSLRDVCILTNVIGVVDISAIRAQLRDEALSPLVREQLSAANLVVANKWDRSTVIERIGVRRTLRREAPRAALVAAEHGRIPVEMILSNPDAVRVVERGGANPSTEQSGITVAHFDDARPFHPERFERWLRAEWPGVLRVKGFVWIATDMTGVYVLDAAGDQREVGLEATWLAAMPPEERPIPVPDRPFGDRRQRLTVIGTHKGVANAGRDILESLLSDEEFHAGAGEWSSYPDPLTPQFA